MKARELLGEEAIIGVTVSSVEEAKRAISSDANISYLGIGTMFASTTYAPLLDTLRFLHSDRTCSKTNTKSIIGTAGTSEILEYLGYQRIPTVAIGGINASNVQRVMFQSHAPVVKSQGIATLDGVAVVSAVIAADDPRAAAKHLRERIDSVPPFLVGMDPYDARVKDVDSLLQAVPAVIKDLAEKSPLCHNMTNLVVQNFAANVVLAM